ncbi:endonuclease/exonuclease/phosphatase family protein [Mycolicibacterium diernhoferi]|uniref:endonuclease/exonuclease/phosphatase family protein n=1 Tax=Mycolicibacterium diernhoferi TaxID=1801 RepID=UPI000A5B06B9|nr:endonuclease/exonuclease/phosphatase family protein [Mycolicibacterium diernhoferi]
MATAALLYGAAALLAQTLSLSNLVALIVAASAPYAPLASFAALVIAVLYRRKVLAAAAAILLTAALAIQIPWLYLGHTSDGGPETTELRVLASNLQKGHADAPFFVDLATRSADVITVSELTAEAVTRLREAGIRKVFPYSILEPRPNAKGMGLWSRYPLTALPRSTHRNNFIAARVRVPGVQNNPLVASVHLTSPLAAGANTFDAWQRRITAAKTEFTEYAETAGPAAVIIAGDFNATADMKQFRDLLTTGYRDAVNQTGAGFMPTYSPHPWIPPVIAIDHVLTRNSAVQSIHSVDVPGSDHRALLATVAIPLDPTEP